MKFKNIVFLSAIMFIGSLNSFSAVTDSSDMGEIVSIDQKANEIVSHIVAKGETVYSIAATYNTTVNEIYRLNPKAEKGIKTGDKLQVIKMARKATGFSNHQIEAKETLFSVSRMYNISVDDLKKANVGLDESTFNIGKTIRIPSFNTSSVVAGNNASANINIEYKVKKGDTLYNIGKNNNVSVEALLTANPSLKDGGLKDGMILIIPRSANGQKLNDKKQEPLIAETPYAKKGETVRVGVLFPFMDNGGSIPKEKLIEYYEGFLLAVKEVKEKGLNAEIYTFDIGAEKNTKKLESLLGTNEMKNLHLVIGGVSKQQIDVLTKFSKRTGIKYVVPFASVTDLNTIPTMFQMTTSHSSLYSEVVTTFKSRFRDHNIIFVSEAGSNNDKSDFVNELKKELTRSNIQFKTTASSESLSDDVMKLLSSSEKNILIPTSSSELTLRRLLVAINSAAAESITLFGYPEWQTYTQHTASLHKYNSYIYSIFFLNEQAKEVQNFEADYKKWYNKNLVNSFPKYGYLGYDAGLYFLSALNKYGSNFENNIGNLRVATLQSAVHFAQVNHNGGFINDGLYLIHYQTGSGIEKIDISK
ncbi:LysM peptidoglycan-binding domain-containing protein [Dysgonomonas sp. Marseille-P4677]|uniref:LysM peptidoglycan-binding domain-containing protein n=1 Tax=Dysgonomonas sp. Marseille-P4677 TaxID=2364790 RepID=UPI0019143368|nr:LysM domain-containing protein [Dysgonomonas sp. Marseille-P4677]MBK5719700.1 LysM peptidoglycan-binding domain-containing protein [Dysgonomonas sp. Marseille-P4677]